MRRRVPGLARPVCAAPRVASCHRRIVSKEFGTVVAINSVAVKHRPSGVRICCAGGDQGPACAHW
jgi:hypothetical protein